MGEDRQYVAVVARSKRGRRVIIERYYPGSRSNVALSLLWDYADVEIDDPLYNASLIGFTLLTEDSFRLKYITVRKCGLWALPQVAGRWAGKQVYILGDNLYDDVDAKRLFGDVASVTVVDISPLVELAMAELAACEYFSRRSHLFKEELYGGYVDLDNDEMLKRLGDFAVEHLLSAMLDVAYTYKFSTPGIGDAAEHWCREYSIYCDIAGNSKERQRFDHLVKHYTMHYKHSGDLSNSVAELLANL